MNRAQEKMILEAIEAKNQKILMLMNDKAEMEKMLRKLYRANQKLQREIERLIDSP